MKKLMIIAGEASGDFLGGKLIHQLHQINPNIKFVGIGGVFMKKEGLKVLAPMDTLSIMGFTQVIKSLIQIFSLKRKLINYLETQKVDGVITIDAPGFNFWLGKKIKKLGVPHIHYVGPTVWAYKASRAKKISKFLQAVLCLFPFEPPYFEKEGLKAFFVGHPLVERFKTVDKKTIESFLKNFNLAKKAKILTLLPGSRSGELKYHVPTFFQAIKLFCKDNTYDAIFIPTVKKKKPLLKMLIKQIDTQGLPPIYIEEREEYKPALYQISTLALAASGTVTLELASSYTPMVVAYKVSKINAFIARFLLKIPYVSMVNILFKKQVVPELLQGNCTPEKIDKALRTVQKEPEKQLKYLKEVPNLLTPDDQTPSKKAAKIITNLWSLQSKKVSSQ